MWHYSELNLNQYSVASPCRTICTVCGSPPCPGLNLIHYINQAATQERLPENRNSHCHARYKLCKPCTPTAHAAASDLWIYQPMQAETVSLAYLSTA
ncbi:hypothetical protein EZJ17_01525 [Eikenella exigua]|uniref:Uncharacterized protein n=1 Tax=Eikenella exigua TaxID=2528037 RepID=A0AAX1F5X1_9NEIS|nr:hypothetical protein EZJ17_01525 [Eikenella exigua]